MLFQNETESERAIRNDQQMADNDKWICMNINADGEEACKCEHGRHVLDENGHCYWIAPD